MKYDYGYSTDDVAGYERRHDRAKTLITWRAYMSLHTCFLQFEWWEVSWFDKFQADIPEHFGLELKP